MTKWNKIEPEIWKPEKEGDEISGTLLGIDENVGEFKGNVYHLETEKGKHLSFFGSTVLDDKLKHIVVVGDLIKIVFKGKVQGEKREYKDYDIFKADPNTD